VKYKKIVAYFDLNTLFVDKCRLKYNPNNINKLLNKNTIFNWYIITHRSFLNKYFIKRSCSKHKIYPKDIITYPYIRSNFDNCSQIGEWKSSILSNIISDDDSITDIIYVDNNIKVLEHIVQLNRLTVCTLDVFSKVVNSIMCEEQ